MGRGRSLTARPSSLLRLSDLLPVDSRTAGVALRATRRGREVKERGGG